MSASEATAAVERENEKLRAWEVTHEHITSDDGTGYCPEAERLARENGELRELLREARTELIRWSEPPRCPDAMRVVAQIDAVLTNPAEEAKPDDRLVSLGRWKCGATGLEWEGDISNHHGITPGEGFCSGPHLPAAEEAKPERENP